jgi:NADH-quinone oxidoreductase subunit J
MTSIIFYIIASFLILSSFTVVIAKNPVKSVMALVFAFFNAAALMLMIGAEFLAALFIIVYVGAVIVLFLFAVMTLSTEDSRKSLDWARMPLLVTLASGFLSYAFWFNRDYFTILTPLTEINNTKNLGMELYTKYFLQFQLSGLILLTALLGVIMISPKDATIKRKKQNLFRQLMARSKDRIKLIKNKT